MDNKNKDIIENQENYKYDFKDENAFVFKTSKGSEKNIKLTTPDDLDIFKALLKTERPAWIKQN